jgi:pimeloyl-ACP methyl ester carboxylesterase
MHCQFTSFLKPFFVATAFVLIILPLQIQVLLAAPPADPVVTEPNKSSAKEKGIPVAFKSGAYTLKGRLIAPQHSSTKLPAIIFCVGSGGNSSPNSNYASFLGKLFEQNLPLDSIALFYFDKRGVGESEGKWYNTNFEERAADAKAAADYLKTLPFIDSSRIAVVGHSQGGWIAQICLSKYPETFAGGISMAGPTLNVKEQVRNDYATTLLCERQMTEEEARAKALKQVNRDFFIASLFPLKDNWKQLKVIKSFEPAKYLTSVSKPLLLMFGENDGLVSPSYSMAELNRLYPAGIPEHIQTVTIKGANHSFYLSTLCYKGPSRALSYSEECKRQLRQWTEIYLLKP